MPEKKKRPTTRNAQNPDRAQPSGGVTRSDLLLLLAGLENQVKVAHGANEDTFDGLVGKSVSEVRDALREAFNIPSDAIALVNGQPVTGDYRLQKNDALEFLRTSGARRV